MAPPAFASWFQEVVPAVLRGLRDHNKSAGKTAIRGRPLFLVTQAWGEQSPGAVGLPSKPKNGNRLFNVHALPLTRDPDGTPHGIAPGQEEDGVSIQGLSQGEGETVETRVKKTSSTFVYSSTYRAVTHYLSLMPARYPEAYKTLTDPAGTMKEFFENLQKKGFAKHKAYPEDMVKFSGQMLPRLKDWLKYRVAELDAKIAPLEQYEKGLDQTTSLGLEGIGEVDQQKRQAAADLDVVRARLAPLRDEVDLLRGFLAELP
jgi:hypothetical protein